MYWAMKKVEPQPLLDDDCMGCVGLHNIKLKLPELAHHDWANDHFHWESFGHLQNMIREAIDETS